jgi:hypothetical protein
MVLLCCADVLSGSPGVPPVADGGAGDGEAGVGCIRGVVGGADGSAITPGVCPAGGNMLSAGAGDEDCAGVELPDGMGAGAVNGGFVAATGSTGTEFASCAT